jgi:hypothetical protein
MPDGKLCELTEDDFQPGNVLREISKSSYVACQGQVRSADAGTKFGTAISPAFADCVVVEDRSDDDTQWVMLERPHAQLQGSTLMIGVERFKVPRKRLCGPDSSYRLVCLDSGKPVNIAR